MVIWSSTILWKDLGIRAKKFKHVHELKPLEHRVSRTFSECVVNETAIDPHHKTLVLIFTTKLLYNNDFNFEWPCHYLDTVTSKKSCTVG